MTGPIPAELGGLAALEALEFYANPLTGPIPVELGGLANLWWLHLAGNPLTGPIPSELGNLANLRELRLNYNRLAGPIPATLGALVDLEILDLSLNDLPGPVPAALGALTSLGALRFKENYGLTGPISLNLTNLRSLWELELQYTDLCVPATGEFSTWLQEIGRRFRGATCGHGQFRFTADAPATGRPLRMEHLTDLRTAVAVLRERCGLGPARWTDPLIRYRVTPVKAVHLTELRTALAEASEACGRTPPAFAEPAPARGARGADSSRAFLRAPRRRAP